MTHRVNTFLRFMWLLGVAFLIMFAMSGCTQYGIVKSAVAINGAKAADAELEVSEWGVCEAPTMGAWQRRYGTSPEKIDGWKKLCTKSVSAPTPPAQ